MQILEFQPIYGLLRVLPRRYRRLPFFRERHMREHERDVLRRASWRPEARCGVHA